MTEHETKPWGTRQLNNRTMRPNQQSNVFARRPGLLVSLGAGLTGLGVLFEFLLDHLQNTQSFEFSLLDYVSFPALVTGILLLCIGGVMWGRRTSPVKVAASGAIIAALSLASARLTSVNIHDWTGSLMFVYASIVLLGVVLLLVGGTRFAHQGTNESRKSGFGQAGRTLTD